MRPVSRLRPWVGEPPRSAARAIGPPVIARVGFPATVAAGWCRLARPPRVTERRIALPVVAAPNGVGMLQAGWAWLGRAARGGVVLGTTLIIATRTADGDTATRTAAGDTATRTAEGDPTTRDGGVG